MNNSKLLITMTSDCNLRCSYCYQKEEGYMKKVINIKKLFKIIEIFKKTNFTPSLKKNIVFIGGEALLVFSLIEKVVNKYGDYFCYSLTTNGTLLTDEIINFLVVNKFHLIISFDGLPKVHNKNRFFENGLGSFDLVYKNSLKLIRYKYLSINFVLTIDNIKYLFENLYFFYKNGFSKVNVVFDINQIDNKEYKFILSVLDKYELFFKKKGFLNEYLYTKETIINFFSSSETCGDSMFNSMSVDVNGDIYLCLSVTESKNPKMNIGNISDIDIHHKILNYQKEVLKFLKENYYYKKHMKTGIPVCLIYKKSVKFFEESINYK